MKKKTFLLALASCFGGLGLASGQGLLSIGSDGDFAYNLPFTVTLAAGGGWDSNMNVSSFDEQESWYYQFGGTASYGNGDRRTAYNIGATFNSTYYDDPGPGLDDWYYNGRLSFRIRHEATERLTIADHAYLAYEFEPDYSIGASTSRRNDQYLYGYNNLSVAYGWTRRFQTVLNYTITGIDYEEDELDSEDRFSHLIGLQGKYALTRTTFGTAEYRFRYTDYDTADRDYYSHYFLVGVDHSFSRTLSGSIRGGVEYRDYDGGNDYTRPYVEGALNYAATEQTNFRVYTWLGMDDNDLGSYEEQYAWRTGFTATHKFLPNLTGTAGMHYVHSAYQDSPIVSDVDEDLISLNLGVNYSFAPNWGVYTSYYYINVWSDNEFREYDRHRVAFGINATF